MVECIHISILLAFAACIGLAVAYFYRQADNSTTVEDLVSLNQSYNQLRREHEELLQIKARLQEEKSLCDQMRTDQIRADEGRRSSDKRDPQSAEEDKECKRSHEAEQELLIKLERANQLLDGYIANSTIERNLNSKRFRYMNATIESQQQELLECQNVQKQLKLTVAKIQTALPDQDLLSKSSVLLEETNDSLSRVTDDLNELNATYYDLLSNNSNLQQKMDHLVQNHSTADSAKRTVIEQLNTQLREKDGEIRRLNEALSVKNSDISRLSSVNNDLTGNFEQLKLLNVNLNDSFKLISDRLEICIAEKERVEQTLEDELNKTRTFTDQLNVSLRLKSEELDQSELICNQTVIRNNQTANVKIEQVNEQVRDKDGEIMRLNSVLSSKNYELSRLSNVNNDLTGNIEQLKLTYVELNVSSKLINDQLEASITEKQKIQQILQDARALTDQLHASVRLKAEELSQAELMCNQNIIKNNKTANDKLDMLSEQITVLQRDKSDIQGIMNGIAQEMADIQSQNAELVEGHEQLTADVVSLENVKSTLEENLAEMGRRMNNLNETVDHCWSSKRVLENELERMRANYTAAVESKNETIEELLLSIHDRESEMLKLYDDNSRAKETLAAKTAQLERTETANKARIDALNNEKRELVDQAADLMLENSATKRRFSRLQVQHQQECADELDTLREANEREMNELRTNQDRVISRLTSEKAELQANFTRQEDAWFLTKRTLWSNIRKLSRSSSNFDLQQVALEECQIRENQSEVFKNRTRVFFNRKMECFLANGANDNGSIDKCRYISHSDDAFGSEVEMRSSQLALYKNKLAEMNTYSGDVLSYISSTISCIKRQGRSFMLAVQSCESTLPARPARLQ